MIPRRFFWLLDSTVLAVAFAVTYAVVPLCQSFLDATRGAWMENLSPPESFRGGFPPISEFFPILAATVPSAIFLLELFGGYGQIVDARLRRISLPSFLASFGGVSFLILIFFALKQTNWSRLFIFAYAVVSGFALSGLRCALRMYFRSRRKAGYYERNVLFIGAPVGIEKLLPSILIEPICFEYKLYGYLATEPAMRSEASRFPCLGTVGELGDLLIQRPIHEVIVVLPNHGGPWLNEVVKTCDYFRVLLRIVPEAILLVNPRDLVTVGSRDSLQLPAVVLRPLHVNSEALFIKRVFDIVVSFALLVLLSPVFALIAIALKLTTPGLPIFYRWRVVGQKGTVFTGYKFTTMTADADDKKAELIHRNEMTGPVFKIKDDPRVTPIGRLLRKYSLNELPQLWSVLKGDMSLVGPRPAFPHELEGYVLWQKRKLSVKPGITCLWQVRGRNKIQNFDDWVRMDLEYIENWSLWLDFTILLRTAWVVARGTGS